MTLYRHRGVYTVIDTTREAEFDYACLQVSKECQERIAGHLKETPRSVHDRLRGDLRVRQIEGWDVMFVIAADREHWVITIAGVAPSGQMEPVLEYLWRAMLEALPPAVRTLLKGREEK